MNVAKDCVEPEPDAGILVEETPWLTVKLPDANVVKDCPKLELATTVSEETP